MIVEELITVLGFRTKGVSDLDKARKAYERFKASFENGSRTVGTNIGKLTGLFEVQGRQIKKNERAYNALTQSVDRMGDSIRSAALRVTGLSKGYDQAAKSARKARAEFVAAGRAQKRYTLMRGVVPSSSIRSTRASRRADLAGSTALVSPRIRRQSGNRSRAGDLEYGDVGGSVAGVAGVVAGTAAYKAAAAFDRRLTYIGITADASREEVRGLGGELHDMAQATATPIDGLTGGLEALVAQGRKLRESMAFLPSVARTATATGAEVDDIAKTADAVSSNFGIPTSGMQAAFDLMAAGGNAGQFELKDMARYLPSLGPASAAVGFKGQEGLSDLVAMLQAMRKGSGTAEEAVSSMNNILAKMESDKTLKALREAGVKPEEAFAKARKEGKNLVAVFEELITKATKGDVSKIGDFVDDMEFKRGVLALMTYKGYWQKLSGEIQKNSGGTVLKAHARIAQDAQTSIVNLTNAWTRFTSAAAKTADAGGVSKGLTSTAKEFGDIAAALERINEAYEKGGLKGAVSQAAGDAADRMKENRKLWLDERVKTEGKRIAELEADNKATEEKLRKEGYSSADIEKTMKLRREAVEKARRRQAGAQAARQDPDLSPKSPLRMGQDPTAPLQGQSGPIGQGQGSNFGQAFNEAFPVDTTKNRRMRRAPLPPRRPSDLTPTGSIEDILGPVKPEVDTSEIDAAKSKAAEAATTMQSSLGGTYHPQVDTGQLERAISLAQTFASTMRSGVSAMAGAAASSPAGQMVRSAGGSGRPASQAGGTVTASAMRDMSSTVQARKMAQAAQSRQRLAGGSRTDVGGVTVHVANTRASPQEIGKQAGDGVRRGIRSASVVTAGPASA